jgi:type I restriction enzyme S subunit
MGNAAVVDTDERFALAQRIIDLRVYGKIMPAFVSLILNAEPFQRLLDATATGLTAKGIKSAKLRRLPIPIPPVDEQLSIVAKVDELMTVCDELERALRAADESRAALLEAVLHEAMNGRVVGSELAEATA